MWAPVFIMLLWVTWVFTNYLYQLHEHHPILEIMSEVCDRFQAWFPPQLRVHPGDIGCQLLLQPINHTHTHTHNPNNPQRNTCTAHITEFREGGQMRLQPWILCLKCWTRGKGAGPLYCPTYEHTVPLQYRPIIIIIVIIIIMCSIRNSQLCWPHVFTHFVVFQLYRSHLTTWHSVVPVTRRIAHPISNNGEQFTSSK